MKTKRSQIFWFVVAVGFAVYRHYQGDDVGGVAFLGLWGFVYLDHRLSVLNQAVHPSARTPTNCLLSCDIGIDRVLGHPEIERIFGLLKAKALIDAETVDEWRVQLLANWQHGAKKSNTYDTVHIHARGDVLVVNDKIAPFADWIHYQITIPYKVSDGTNLYRHPRIQFELEVRLVAVNGILKLQIGHFDQELSPHIFRPGPALVTYQTYTTLSSFPLMYCAGDFTFPTSAIGLSQYATDSFKDSLGDRRRKGPRDDWHAVMADVRVYGLLCDSYNGIDVSPTDAEIAGFVKKRDEMLKVNGFTDLRPDDKESWRYPNMGRQYGSQFLNVSVQNFNLLRDHQARKWVVDYWEDVP